MGSLTMRSESSDQADGAKSPSPVMPNPRHANIADLQSPTALEPFYSMPALYEMEPTPSAPEVGPVNAGLSPYSAPKAIKKKKRKRVSPPVQVTKAGLIGSMMQILHRRRLTRNVMYMMMITHVMTPASA